MLVVLGVLASCSDTVAHHAQPQSIPARTSHSATPTSHAALPGMHISLPTSRPSRSQFSVRGKRPAKPSITLPRGGRTILGSYRLVAYYGGPDGPALGALGRSSPAHMARVITSRSRQFAGYGKPVQPAMELIASVAQGSPGPGHTYSRTIPAAQVQRYLDVAHRDKMLLILDFQPGRGDFLPQVKKFARFLRDPSVSVALDPEWKMHGGQVPGQVIGWASAASINRVQSYVSAIVTKNALPDKLMMVHQFTLGMLPDRNRIRHYPGLELTFHADGFGSRKEKLSTYRALGFPGRPDGAGFKLFLTQDSGGLMTASQVMALRPRPDVITYQ